MGDDYFYFFYEGAWRLPDILEAEDLQGSDKLNFIGSWHF